MGLADDLGEDERDEEVDELEFSFLFLPLAELAEVADFLGLSALACTS
jgi:hypothetical protein